MPKHKPLPVLRTGLDEHAATKAWLAFSRTSRPPSEIHVLQEVKKAGVYRLSGVGGDGTAVIAKRRVYTAALTEIIIHSEILPHLPVSQLEFYGWSQEQGGKHCWLFMEDAGDVPLRVDDGHHRALAAEWLGLMHVSAARVPAAAELRARGPGWYLEQLRSARETILSALAARGMNHSEASELRTTIAQLDILEKKWNEIESCCAAMPMTMVHGDFVSRNVAVRSGPAGEYLLPFDWDVAGWGSPAVDFPGGSKGKGIDLDVYWHVVQAYWPQLSFGEIQNASSVGYILRLIAAISWIAQDLRWAVVKLENPMIEHCVRSFRIYNTFLATAWSRECSFDGLSLNGFRHG